MFRPDWENVVGPVVDHLLERPDVNHDQIALFGVSLGGVLAPRAAAFEHRLAALMVLDGYTTAETGPPPRCRVTGTKPNAGSGRTPSPRSTPLYAEQMNTEPSARWSMSHGMYVMGAATPRQLLATALDYHVADGIAEKIACPTLVCAAANDEFFEGQPEALFQHLTCDKTFVQFTAEERADAHCQFGAQPWHSPGLRLARRRARPMTRAPRTQRDVRPAAGTAGHRREARTAVFDKRPGNTRPSSPTPVRRASERAT